MEEKPTAIREFSQMRINALFALLALADFMYGVSLGDVFGYLLPVTKGLGLSNSSIELFCIGNGLGGLLSGFIYIPLLMKINKEVMFLATMTCLAIINFISGTFFFVEEITSHFWAVGLISFSSLTSMGLARCGIVNYTTSFAAEAFPKSVAQKMSITFGCLQLGVFLGPILELPLYGLFGYSAPFILNCTIILVLGITGYFLSPTYPPSLQKEKIKSKSSLNSDVQVSNWDILKQPMVFSFIFFYIQFSITQKMIGQAFPLYIVDEFSTSSKMTVLLTNSPYCLGVMILCTNFILLNYFHPLNLCLFESLFAIVGCSLAFLNNLVLDKSLILAMLGNCFAMAGCQFTSMSGQITLELATDALEVQSSYAVRDKTINIVTTSMFLSWILASIQLSLMSIRLGYEHEMLVEGSLCAFSLVLFLYIRHRKEQRKRKGFQSI